MSWIKDKVFANADDFIKWLDKEFGDYIDKHINQQHTHHTWKPNHSNYPKYTTLQLHQNMRNTHVNSNGWSDIAQNITIGKDGDIVTGRDIKLVPVSALGHNGTTNSHPFAYEMIGNFDKGNDLLEGKQLESAIKISRYFYKKGKSVKFHRELLLPNGMVPKTCPGTGIEKDWFMDLVKDSKYDSPKKVVTKPVVTPKPVVQPAPKTEPKNETPKPVEKPFQLVYTRLLKEGSEGNDVKQLQKALNKLNFKCGKEDGVFGKLVKDAVTRFQKVYLPYDIDSLVGKQTISEINKRLK
jgi:hypothetical protein